MKAYEVMANPEKWDGKEFEVVSGHIVKGRDGVKQVEYISKVAVRNGDLQHMDENGTWHRAYVSFDDELTEIKKIWMPTKPESGKRYYKISSDGMIVNGPYHDAGFAKGDYDNFNCFPVNIYTKDQLERDHVASMAKVQRMVYMKVVEEGWCEGVPQYTVYYSEAIGRFLACNILHCGGGVVCGCIDYSDQANKCADWLNSLNINAWGEKK